ncbi:phosphoglycerate mutase [Moniliophthora roreri]|nr:phosphoglycerate mutase [Moniliophthora roreri]
MFGLSSNAKHVLDVTDNAVKNLIVSQKEDGAIRKTLVTNDSKSRQVSSCHWLLLTTTGLKIGLDDVDFGRLESIPVPPRPASLDDILLKSAAHSHNSDALNPKLMSATYPKTIIDTGFQTIRTCRAPTRLFTPTPFDISPLLAFDDVTTFRCDMAAAVLTQRFPPPQQAWNRSRNSA